MPRCLIASLSPDRSLSTQQFLKWKKEERKIKAYNNMADDLEISTPQ